MATQNKWSKKGLSLACVVAKRPVTTRQYATINLGTDPGYTGLPTGVPKGGAVHQAIRKTAAGDYAMAWTDDPAHAASHAPGGADAIPWTQIHGRGTTAQKPAASPANAGYTWFDTTLLKLLRSNGAAWEDCEGVGSGGGSSLTNIPIGVPSDLPSVGNVQIYPAYVLANLVPDMTSDTAPSGVCSASEYYNQYPPWQAFSDSGTGWVSNGSALPQSLQYQPSVTTTILAYEITPWSLDYFPSTTPTDWKLQGLDNGTWVDVDARSVSSSSWVINTPTRFTLSSPASYEAYRLYITANGGRNYVGIRRLKLLGLGPNIAMFMRDSSGNVKQLSFV